MNNKRFYGLIYLLLLIILITSSNAESNIKKLTNANIPYLIEAKLTESAIIKLTSKVGAAKYTIDYFHSSNGGHSTIAYKPTKQTYSNLKPYLTNNMYLSVDAYCWSDKYNVEAALAKLYNSNNIQIKGMDLFQHIKISFGSNKKAVDSNYLFECSSNNYASYSYCIKNNLHITDLICKKFTSPLSISATLKESFN